MRTRNVEGLSWRTSSYSGANGQGGCVAMAKLSDAIAVRDSKNPTGPILVFPHPAWHALTTAG